MSLTFDHAYRDRGFHNFEENLKRPRHRWYPFKEGFSSQLVEEAIGTYPTKRIRTLRVLDPFGGSGTTPLTAALLGHNATAVEVNPFCAFTARVKCLPGQWHQKHFRQIVQRTLTEASHTTALSPLEGLSTFTEQDDLSKWLFNREIIRSFTSLNQAIWKLGQSYTPALRLAAIRAAMDCCNAKKDGKCLRYLPNWKTLAYEKDDFQKAFKDTTEAMLQDVEVATLPRNREITLQCADSRKALTRFQANSFDLVVTSPPYLNSFDYSDVYRPELFLGEFVNSNKELQNIRLRTIRSHLQVKWGGSTNINHTRIKEVVAVLREKKDLWNKNIPLMVEAYFHDMNGLLEQTFRVLCRGAEAWIVVSTSAYNGVQIPVDLILADLGCEAGFKLRGVYALRSLRAAGQQQEKFDCNGLPLRESLIILSK